VFEPDVTDEEVKKKKRLVLIALAALLVGGVVGLSLTTAPSPTGVAQAGTPTPNVLAALPQQPTNSLTPAELATVTATAIPQPAAGQGVTPPAGGGATLAPATTPKAPAGEGAPQTATAAGTETAVTPATAATPAGGQASAGGEAASAGGETPVAPTAAATRAGGQTSAGSGTEATLTPASKQASAGNGAPGMTPAASGGTPAGGAVASPAGAPLAPTASSMPPPSLLPVTGAGSDNVPLWPILASAVILLGAGVAGLRHAGGKRG
jgi:hypothetical protein